TRGNLNEKIWSDLSSLFPPLPEGIAFLRSISANSVNEFLTTEGKIWDVEIPDLGTQHFQILFPFKVSAAGTMQEDALIMLVSRPELEAQITFDSIFSRSSSVFREMDGEYETRIAVFQIDTGSVKHFSGRVSWPASAYTDKRLSALARRAFDNGWTGSLSRTDGSIEAARAFTKTPFLAVGVAEPRGGLGIRGLQLSFWLLFAYTLTLLSLTTYFLGRLFEKPLDRLIAAVQRLKGGELGLTVHIDSGDEFGKIGDEVTRMSRGLRERNRLRRFVSELAADAASTNEETGKRIELTVLFSHIRDFAALSDELGPSKTVELLNGYFTVMEEAVRANSGTIDKFIGDAVMAVFHPDIAGRDHAEAACKAALAMRRSVLRLNADRKSKNSFPIQTGTGIATGMAISGRVGSAIRRQDYTVIGDTVNLAARLETLAGNGKFGPIVLSEATVTAAGPHINASFVDSVQVKGKRECVQAFCLHEPGAG
ncbi:MAG TPA: adenylate/guanylate cyclase domain-containing protein, partial [Candidatus Ozemobacteraceae bacterium]|nr:adenylate/guanylate cyclase domain-containing protein [Candidatus Ozemobacteraceae bacterium]